MLTHGKRRCPSGSVPVQINVPRNAHQVVKAHAALNGTTLQVEMQKLFVDYAEHLREKLEAVSEA